MEGGGDPVVSDIVHEGLFEELYVMAVVMVAVLVFLGVVLVVVVIMMVIMTAMINHDFAILQTKCSCRICPHPHILSPLPHVRQNHDSLLRRRDAAATAVADGPHASATVRSGFGV